MDLGSFHYLVNQEEYSQREMEVIYEQPKNVKFSEFEKLYDKAEKNDDTYTCAILIKKYKRLYMPDIPVSEEVKEKGFTVTDETTAKALQHLTNLIPIKFHFEKKKILREMA